MSRFRPFRPLAALALAALALLSPRAAAAQEVYLNFLCDLNGAPAQMLMAVHYQNASGISVDTRGKITGVFPTGVNVYTAGTVTSATGRYSFRGENAYADFVDLIDNARFRVQWQLDGQRNGVWAIINPHGDGSRHFCAYRGPAP